MRTVWPPVVAASSRSRCCHHHFIRVRSAHLMPSVCNPNIASRLTRCVCVEKMPCRKNKATNHIHITTYQFAFLCLWTCFSFFAACCAHLLFFCCAIPWWWWWRFALCVFPFSALFSAHSSAEWYEHQAWLACNVNINKVVNVVKRWATGENALIHSHPA